jgi:hypothetical protein
MGSDHLGNIPTYTGVPFNMKPATTARRNTGGRTAGKRGSRNARRGRRTLARGFRVTRDTFHNKYHHQLQNLHTLMCGFFSGPSVIVSPHDRKMKQTFYFNLQNYRFWKRTSIGNKESVLGEESIVLLVTCWKFQNFLLKYTCPLTGLHAFCNTKKYMHWPIYEIQANEPRIYES